MDYYDAIASIIKLIPNFDIDKLIYALDKNEINFKSDTIQSFKTNNRIHISKFNMTYIGHKRDISQVEKSSFADGNSMHDSADIIGTTKWKINDTIVFCKCINNYSYSCAAHCGGVEDYNLDGTEYDFLYEPELSSDEQLITHEMKDLIKNVTDLFSITPHDHNLYLKNSPNVDFSRAIYKSLEEEEYYGIEEVYIEHEKSTDYIYFVRDAYGNLTSEYVQDESEEDDIIEIKACKPTVKPPTVKPPTVKPPTVKRIPKKKRKKRKEKKIVDSDEESD